MTRVLVVDDSALIRRKAREALEGVGYTVEEAHGGREALDVLGAKPPDAVILNAEMPDTTTYEVIDEIHDRGLGLPVIVATAREAKEVAREFLQRGASDFISKDPLFGVRVVNAVHRSITLEREPAVEVPEDDPGRVLVLDDSPVIRRVVHRILESSEMPLAVVDAEAAEQALETMEEQDFDVLLVDHVLPGMDGAELLDELRSRGIRTPALALTGQRDPELAERFLEAGAYGIWTKEHEGPLRLRTSVERLVRLNRLEAGQPSPPAAPTGP